MLNFRSINTREDIFVKMLSPQTANTSQVVGNALGQSVMGKANKTQEQAMVNPLWKNNLLKSMINKKEAGGMGAIPPLKVPAPLQQNSTQFDLT